MVQHRFHRGLELKGTGHSLFLGRGGEICPVKGQEPGGPGLRRQTALHVRVDDEDLRQRTAVVAVQQHVADLPGPFQCGILGSVEKALLHRNAPLGKAAPPVLPHHKELGIRMLREEVLGLFHHVLVVSAGQSLVRRDNEAAVGPIPGSGDIRWVEIAAVHAVGRAEDPLDLPPQGLKVGSGIGKLRLGLAHFGGGDEVHGVGDLPGLPDALDASLDLLGPRHGHAPAFRSARKRRVSSRMASLSSGGSSPVASMRWQRAGSWVSA